MATAISRGDLAMTFVKELQNANNENVELVMNYATGYVLSRERDFVCQQSSTTYRHEKTYKLKSVDYLKKEVFIKMKAYEAEQNRKEEEGEQEEEEEGEEEDQEEKGQKKWIAKCVSEMITDYQYEEMTKEKELKKKAAQSLQVCRCLNISIC